MLFRSVANAALILFITLIPGFFPAWEKHKASLKGFAFGWVMIVAASRIVMGAHFLSDVTFGFLVTFLIFLLFSKVFRTDSTR